MYANNWNGTLCGVWKHKQSLEDKIWLYEKKQYNSHILETMDVHRRKCRTKEDHKHQGIRILDKQTTKQTVQWNKVKEKKRKTTKARQYGTRRETKWMQWRSWWANSKYVRRKNFNDNRTLEECRKSK